MEQDRAQSHNQTRESFLEDLFSQLRLRKIQGYLREEMVICDVGCGYHGYLLRKMCRRVKQGIGIDRFVAKEGWAENCILMEGDLNRKIPLADGSVDAITSLALLEHLSDPVSHLKEVYRILRPNGMLMLTTPTPASKPILEFLAFKVRVISETEIRDHKVYYRRPVIQKMLNDAGFRIQQMTHSYFQFGFNQLVVARK